jgi:hypothetical protein
LTEDKEFDASLMTDRKTKKEAASMSGTANLAHEAAAEIKSREGGKEVKISISSKRKGTSESKFSGVTGKKRKRVG